MYTLKGALKMINETVQISDSFKKREFVVIDDSGQYEQTVLFQAVQDRCELLDKLKEGDKVEVTFFLRGREWTNPKDGIIKVFNSLDAWKIEKTEDGPAVATEGNAETFVAEADDDLPF